MAKTGKHWPDHHSGVCINSWQLVRGMFSERWGPPSGFADLFPLLAQAGMFFLVWWYLLVSSLVLSGHPPPAPLFYLPLWTAFLALPTTLRTFWTVCFSFSLYCTFCKSESERPADWLLGERLQSQGHVWSDIPLSSTLPNDLWDALLPGSKWRFDIDIDIDSTT